MGLVMPNNFFAYLTFCKISIVLIDCLTGSKILRKREIRSKGDLWTFDGLQTKPL